MFPKTLSPALSPPTPLCYCQFVLNFNVSGYILLACLFCWFYPLPWQWIFFEHSLPSCLPIACPFHDGWLTSATAHTTLSVQQFLSKKCMPHPPYSQDLAPSNFLCVPWMKTKSSKGNIFPMWKRWNKKKLEALKVLKTVEFQNYFEQ